MLPRTLATLFIACSLVSTARAENEEPLPLGSASRFGVSRFILRQNPLVAISMPKANVFYAPTQDGGVRKYDLPTHRPLDPNSVVELGQVVLSADGKRAAVARPGLLSVIDVDTGKRLLTVDPPDGITFVGIPIVSLSADGRTLAYGARRGKSAMAVVIDVDTEENIAVIEAAHRAPIHAVISQDGKMLATHGYVVPPVKKDKEDGKPEPKGEILTDAMRMAQIWSVDEGIELFKARVTGMGGYVTCATFSPDGKIFAATAGDGPVDLFDTTTGKRTQTLLGRKSQGTRIAISPDSKLVASIGQDYRTHRWTVDGRFLEVSEPPPGMIHTPVINLEFADNERVIAWITMKFFCVAWEAPAGKLLTPVMDHAAGIRSIAFPADKAKDPLTSGLDGKVFRWDMATGTITSEVTLRPARLPMAPPIRPIVDLTRDGTLAIWTRQPTEVFDVIGGGDLYVVPPPSMPPAHTNLVFSYDGMKLVTASRDVASMRGSCVIWDLKTQKRFAEIDIPRAALGSSPWAGISPDGTRVMFVGGDVSAEERPVLRIVGYDLKTQKVISDFEDPRVEGSMSIGIVNDSVAVIASTKGRVWSVDYANGRILGDFENIPERGEPATSGNVAISADGKRVAIGVVSKAYTTYGARVYDIATRKALHTFVGHRGPVTALRFNDAGDILASGSHDTSVLLWDVGLALKR